MANNTDVLDNLLTAGQPQQAQDSNNNITQALMDLLQPTPSPQSANAALGQSTTNVLNNAASASGNPNLAAGNYDATQNSGINQEQLAQALQKLTQQGGVSNQLTPSQQLTQQVAQKSYTKQLQAHADATPHQILGNLLDQWGANGGTQVPMSSPTGSNPGAAQAQTAQLSPNPVSQGQATGQPTQQNQQQPQDINEQIDNINKQTALNIANRNLNMSQPPNFWQRFGQNFTKMTGGVTQADQLQNMAAGQKIAGQEPLQPKDVGELNAGSYKAALEATGTALSATQQKLTALTDLYGKEEQNKGLVASALKNESPNQAVLRKSIEDTADNMVTHVKNFRTLISNRPTFNSQGINSQAQQTSAKIEQGKVGKYTLVNK